MEERIVKNIENDDWNVKVEVKLDVTNDDKEMTKL
jgi:hypothetical protein